jgi:hypothetical protein
MVPAESCDQTSIPRPAYHRSPARGLHLDALTLVRRLHLLDLCGWAVRLALRQCPPLHVADLLMLLAAVVLAAVALRHGICAARGEQ